MPRLEVATAGASARARYRALTTRTERGVVAGAMGGSAALMIGGIGGWPAGAAGGALVAGVHFALGWMRPGPETDWRRGAAAERRTGRHLSELEGNGYTVLHDRSVPGLEGTNLDHLVIGLTGVYAVITRRIGPRTRLRAGEGRLWAAARDVSGLEATAALAGPLVSAELSAELDKDMEVVPVVAVQYGRVEAELEHAGVRLLAGRSVGGFVRARPVVFTTSQVATIVAAAERLFPPMVGQFN
ncbi:nuclease-related domain-containing protein [Actinocorallia longicatena]|uniref:NERD domain-containing protein n=1 Tax=Actinocorallia longicatena TaxID=111803 RepID=A0ABP6QKN1_9ACTN